MIKLKILVFFCLAAVLMASCSRSPPAPSEGTSQPDMTDSLAAYPTLTMAPSATHTYTPTNTLTSTPTTRPTATLTATPDVTATPTPAWEQSCEDWAVLKCGEYEMCALI